MTRRIAEIKLTTNPNEPHRIILDDGSELTGFMSAKVVNERDYFPHVVIQMKFITSDIEKWHD